MDPPDGFFAGVAAPSVIAPSTSDVTVVVGAMVVAIGAAVVLVVVVEDMVVVVDAGLTLSCTRGRYCPDGLVTRGQMAAFLARGLDL